MQRESNDELLQKEKTTPENASTQIEETGCVCLTFISFNDVVLLSSNDVTTTEPLTKPE